MRLNFSGVGEEQIREGMRRLGEVVREQVSLYGTLTGVEPAGAQIRPVAPPAEPEPRLADERLANVLRLPRKRA
jgi:2-aminoadipate transaminase